MKEVITLASIYHAKLNINEKIFSVYKELVNLQDLLHNLFSKINNNVKIKGSKFTYNFADLNFDNEKLVIYGRLAKVYDSKELNIFDSERKTIRTNNVKNSTDYVAFVFDVKNEKIYFCPIQTFGRKEFLDVFALLIEECYEDIGYVKIYLLTETKQFDVKFNKIERLRTFTAIVIPPNAGSDDAILKKNEIKKEMEEANAKELGIYLKSDVRDPINKKSDLISKIKKFAAKGYGYIKADGRDKDNNEVIINTEEDRDLQKKTPIDKSLRNSSVEIYEQIKKYDK